VLYTHTTLTRRHAKPLASAKVHFIGFRARRRAACAALQYLCTVLCCRSFRQCTTDVEYLEKCLVQWEPIERVLEDSVAARQERVGAWRICPCSCFAVQIRQLYCKKAAVYFSRVHVLLIRKWMWHVGPYESDASAMRSAEGTSPRLKVEPLVPSAVCHHFLEGFDTEGSSS